MMKPTHPGPPARTLALPLLAGLLLAMPAGCGLDVRPGARTLSEAFAPPTPREAAEMALDLEDPDRRFRGTMMLANAPFGGDEVYLTMYEDYIDDPEPNVRGAAARALGNHGEPTHVPLILTLIDDTHDGVRLEAVRALQRLHNPAAIDPLLARIDPEIEDDIDVRAEAAHALGQYANRLVLQRLIAALSDRHLRVTRNALESLRTLTGQDFELDRTAWQSWYSAAGDPFAGQRPYIYPHFERDPNLFERWVPFFPPPPNEKPSTPAGMPADYRASNGS